MRLGLYTGWPGIALAAGCTACYLGETELAVRASALLKRCAAERPDEHRLDLLSGSAGTIVTMLSIAGGAGESDLLDFAALLGDHLLKEARVSGDVYSWPSVGINQRRDLTGFSHGTAGIGYALLQLYEATGDDRYRIGAQGAFQYERTWFDQREGNWPDFGSWLGRIDGASCLLRSA